MWRAQMHADILIVSDVSFPLQPRAALDSALTISNQMLAILVRKDADRQRATLGTGGYPDRAAIGTASSTDFTRRGATISAGENAARSRARASRRIAGRRCGVRRVSDAPRGARARPAGDQVRARR